MQKDRLKEYEAIGRIVVDFETLTGQIKWKLCEQIMYLGLDFEKGHNPIYILLAKMGMDELNQKFHSIFKELFPNSELSSKIEIFSKCVTKLSEIRNLYVHAEWFIGYSEITGTEMDISRGFNDRYGKSGLKRYRILFDSQTFKDLDFNIKHLIRFIEGIELLENEFSVTEESKKISIDDLRRILSFLNELIKKCDVV